VDSQCQLIELRCPSNVCQAELIFRCASSREFVVLEAEALSANCFSNDFKLFCYSEAMFTAFY